MKLLVTKNEYKRANCILSISENLKRVNAYGYEWFKYLTTDKLGNIILSEYTSVTSKDHVNDIETILKRHNLKIALTLDFCNYHSETMGRSISNIHSLGHDGNNLKDINNAINNEVVMIKSHISLLIKNIKTPRAHKKKNEKRKQEIKNCLYKIKDLRLFKNEYLDKKVKKIKNKNNYFVDDKKRLLTCEIFSDIYGNYLKCNDDRQVNYFLNNFKVKQAHLYHNTSKGVPLVIEKLCTLFNLNKNYDFSKIVFYAHIESVENYIPNDENSIEYQDFLKLIKRLKIDKENLNTLALDKIHTAMINKNLRKEKGPIIEKEWLSYDVSEKLLKLETIVNKEKEVLNVIKNQGQLKKESRKMKHCIGQKNMGYHEKIIKKGYHALNFKNYTFFLNSDYSISETHGKHNSTTPENIINELENLLAS